MGGTGGIGGEGGIGGKGDGSLSHSPLRSWGWMIFSVVLAAGAISYGFWKGHELQNTARLTDAFLEDLKTSNTAYLLVNSRGTIRAWSDGATKMLGYAASEMNGRSILLIMPQELQAAHLRAFKKAVERGGVEGEETKVECSTKTKYGKPIDLLITVRSVPESSGEPLFRAMMINQKKVLEVEVKNGVVDRKEPIKEPANKPEASK